MGPPVRVTATGRGEEAETRVQIDLGGALPDGVRLVGDGSGVALGDAILDGHVSVAGPHADSVAARLRAALDAPGLDLRGCLLDVLQGLPAVAVADGGGPGGVRAGRLEGC